MLRRSRHWQACVGKAPHNVQVSPDGKVVWVTNNGSLLKRPTRRSTSEMAQGSHDAMGKPGAVWAIDTATNAVVAKVPAGMHPAHVVVSPDGRFAYITNGGDNTVSVIDTAARSLVATIPVGKFPHGLRISPDGKQAYVANLKGGTVSVIDTASQKEIAQVPAGKGPAQVGFTPDGSLVLVSLSEENAVAVIDPATRKVIPQGCRRNSPHPAVCHAGFAHAAGGQSGHAQEAWQNRQPD